MHPSKYTENICFTSENTLKKTESIAVAPPYENFILRMFLFWVLRDLKDCLESEWVQDIAKPDLVHPVDRLPGLEQFWTVPEIPQNPEQNKNIRKM